MVWSIPARVCPFLVGKNAFKLGLYKTEDGLDRQSRSHCPPPEFNDKMRHLLHGGKTTEKGIMCQAELFLLSAKKRFLAATAKTFPIPSPQSQSTDESLTFRDLLSFRYHESEKSRHQFWNYLFDIEIPLRFSPSWIRGV